MSETKAPTVTQDQIEALLDRVQVQCGPIDGTTTTLAMAFLDGKFFLGSEFSACVSPENFDPIKGIEIARDKLFNSVSNKLWELEGYRLYRSLEQAKQAEETPQEATV